MFAEAAFGVPVVACVRTAGDKSNDLVVPRPWPETRDRASLEAATRTRSAVNAVADTADMSGTSGYGRLKTRACGGERACRCRGVVVGEEKEGGNILGVSKKK
jgi:hypothetical protein